MKYEKSIKGYMDSANVAFSDIKLKYIIAEDTQKQDINYLSFETKTIIQIKPFEEFIKYAKKFSETVTFQALENTLKLSFKTDLINCGAEIPLIKGSNAEYKHYCKYSTEYLKQFLRSIKTKECNNLIFYFSHEYPLLIEYNQREDKHFFLLAPRAEN